MEGVRDWSSGNSAGVHRSSICLQPSLDTQDTLYKTLVLLPS
jgi:hypothetical protein